MRVMIYSVSAGAGCPGPARAAEALEASILQNHPGSVVRHADLLRQLPAESRKSYAAHLMKWLHSLPSLWRWLSCPAERASSQAALAAVSRFVRKLETNGVRDAVAQFKPDLVVTTHFLPAAILSRLLREPRARLRMGPPRIAAVLLDHDIHRLWIQPGIERYYVATPEIASLLQAELGKRSVVRSTGIPCHPKFGELMDDPARRRMRMLLGLAQAPSPTVILDLSAGAAFGAQGAASLGAAISQALKGGAPVTLLAICGRSRSMREALASNLTVPEGTALRFFDTQRRCDLQGLPDLVITRPSGLCASEWLARGVPMILLSPAPGQQQRNVELLLETGCAYVARTPEALALKMQTLLSDAVKLARMREACRRTGRPHAAREIASDLLEWTRRRAPITSAPAAAPLLGLARTGSQ